MKEISSFLLLTKKHWWMWPLLTGTMAFLFTLLAGAYLFTPSIIDRISSIIIEMGLDPQRAQFITGLVMILGAALIGALVSRNRTGAVLGAAVVFWFGYLSGFVGLEMQPVRDPGGHLEPLNQGALATTSMTMLSVALLGGFIGAAVGTALNEVLVLPVYQLVRDAGKRVLIGQGQPAVSGPEALIGVPVDTRGNVFQLIGRWLGALVMVILVVVSTTAGDLFLFAPDVGLHSVPELRGQHGQVVRGTLVNGVLISQALHGQRKDFVVYLPPSYNTPGVAQHRRYPVLYLLHGSPGKAMDWVMGGKANESADTLIALDRTPELIMVMPDGNGRPGATTEWGNSGDGRQMMEDYVVNDLVSYIDHHYRTLADPGHRAIAGLSMGGFGAVNIAVHHPTVFDTVISLGGYYVAEGTIWGLNHAYRQYNSPLFYLPEHRAAWRLHMYLGAATKDQPYYNDTLQFMQLLERQHMSYHFDLQRGYHSWRVWQVQMYNALSWLKWE